MELFLLLMEQRNVYRVHVVTSLHLTVCSVKHVFQENFLSEEVSVYFVLMELLVQLRLSVNVKSAVLELNLMQHVLGVSFVNLAFTLLLDLVSASNVQMEPFLLLSEQRNVYHAHAVMNRTLSTPFV